MTDATAARDAALAIVEAAAPGVWLDLARHTIRTLAATGEPFTSDAVWERIGQPPEPRALGAVMRGLARDGVIVSTGTYHPSQRVQNHCRPVAVWRGAPEFVDQHQPTTLF